MENLNGVPFEIPSDEVTPESYLQTHEVVPDWWKLERSTAEMLLSFVDEKQAEGGKIETAGHGYLGKLMYFAIYYSINGELPSSYYQDRELYEKDRMFHFCLGKLQDAVYQSQLEIAKKRINGAKGGRRRADTGTPPRSTT